MKRSMLASSLSAIVVLLSAPVTPADNIETLAQARRESALTGKPILLQFYHDDCEYCDQAERDARTDVALKLAYERVVLLHLGVMQGEGASLAEIYRVGDSYPVFIVADSAGRPMSRWTGYTGVDRFIKSFNAAMSEYITVDARAARCTTSASSKDALFLADYFTDTREYLRARDYVRMLQGLYGQSLDFSFRLFTVTAEAVWTGLLPFDSLIAAADSVVARKMANLHNVGKTAQIMANVARKTGHTDKLERFLMAGIEATSRRSDSTGIALHRDLLADYALHARADTSEALIVKKNALGPRWQRDLAKCFEFGEWCFRRNLNLAEAEHYVRLATDKATGDKFRATHLRLLAEICHARSNDVEAFKLADQALALDPSATWFEKKLAEWRRGK